MSGLRRSNERRNYQYPEFFHQIHAEVLSDNYQPKEREPSSNEENEERGNDIEREFIDSHPVIENIPGDSVKDFDWYIEPDDGSEKRKGQTKSCVPQHVNSYKKGTFFIPNHTLKNEHMKNDGVFNFVIADYEGNYDGPEDLTYLMEINLPGHEVHNYIDTDITGVRDIQSAGGVTVRYDIIIELCEEILEERGESFNTFPETENEIGLI